MWIKNIHDRSSFSLFIHALFCTMSGNKVMFPISEGNLNFLLCSENLRRDLCWRHCKYKEWVSFFSVHGKWIAVRNKQIAREPLCGSRDLFVPHCDSFPMNWEKRHAFLKYTNYRHMREETKIQFNPQAELFAGLQIKVYKYCWWHSCCYYQTADGTWIRLVLYNNFLVNIYF